MSWDEFQSIINPIETGVQDVVYPKHWNALLDHGLEKAASYIIRKKGAYYEAINGNTGKIDFGSSKNVGGISGSDARAVIQAAINAEPKGLILLKKNLRTINFGASEIQAPANADLNICGEDMNAIIIQYSGSGSLFSLATVGYAMFLRGFQIQYTGSSPNTAIGLDLSGAGYSHIEDVVLFGPWNNLIKINNGMHNNLFNVSAQGAYNHDIGLLIMGDSYNNCFFNCVFKGVSNGVKLNGSSVALNCFFGGIIASIAGVALLISGSAFLNYFSMVDIEADSGRTFQIDAGCRDNQIIGGNATRGAAGSDFLDNGTRSIVRFIVCGASADPKPTENSGTATIPSGQASVVVNHGCIYAPSMVWIEVNHDELKDYKITNKTSTQFTVTVPSNVSADRQFNWKAEVD